MSEQCPWCQTLKDNSFRPQKLIHAVMKHSLSSVLLETPKLDLVGIRKEPQPWFCEPLEHPLCSYGLVEQLGKEIEVLSPPRII